MNRQVKSWTLRRRAAVRETMLEWDRADDRWAISRLIRLWKHGDDIRSFVIFWEGE